ncbi:MAG TPA: tol-pal system protein YbgF [Burkholderiales bacterium]|nr:tol-pal system protein YbgF [Burkholderiales bacterium]
MKVRYVLLFAAALAPLPACALFSDDEARKGVADLQKRVDAQQQVLQRIERDAADKRPIIELSNLIDGLRQDIATLRGQIEVLANRIDGLDKRQKDLYVDLDSRLRKFEQGQADKEKAAQAAVAEQQAYEAGLAQFKANNYGAAIQSLQSFMTTYPQSPLASSAQYWIGNAYYALRDYKNAIAAQQKVIANWPESAKASDALLNIASSQAESGDANGSRNTLRTLVSKYPNTPAAEQAKQRLAKK